MEFRILYYCNIKAIFIKFLLIFVVFVKKAYKKIANKDFSSKEMKILKDDLVNKD